MIKKPLHLPVEETMDEYVENFGGELIKKIVPPNPPFFNADYLFRKYGVIAELKTLEKDFFTEKDYQKKINNLYSKWVEMGLVKPVMGKIKIESRDLPQQCQLDIANMVKKPLENRISKANKQIKETKKYFKSENFKGLLILVNDGNYSLESDAVMYLVNRIVNTQCTSIDSVIYFTVNMRADMPGFNRDILIWIDKNRCGSEGVSRLFLDDFRNGWINFVERKTGEDIPQIKLDNHKNLDEIKFIKD
jgi:hypothetical protein